MSLDKFDRVYFIGIGGIGMSALARWFNHQHKEVAGYDRVQTPLCSNLESEGIDIHYVDDITLIDNVFFDKASTLVVFTPAIPNEHNELTYFKSNGFDVLKRSEVLGMITDDKYTIAVAGTHGKTTTSSMVAHLLQGLSGGCSAFVGGIMTNYDTNVLIEKQGAPIVVEADEFDRSFMSLHPDVSVVTSLDPDHLDIYGDADSMKLAYEDFMRLTDENGLILLHENAAEKVDKKLTSESTTYGLQSAMVMAKNIRVEDSCFVFDYAGNEKINDLRLSVPGFHNVMNATAAVTVALHMEMEPELIRERLSGYTGVKRRFEYIIKSENFIFIDDYAHHPSEISALLSSIKKLYPAKKVTVVFQPHLFTRTRDFMDGFAKSLSVADEVILLDIYPAREVPILGVTSDVILDKIEHSNKWHFQKKDFPGVLDRFDPQVLLTIGAGDIDTLVPKIKNYYSKLTVS